MLILMALCSIVQARHEPIVTPYFQKDPLEIRSIHSLSTDVKRYGIEELTVDLGATFDNPFDPEDVSLDAKITGPGSESYTIPGFFYRPYDHELAGGKEVLKPNGQPSWRVRISPTQTGSYAVVLTLKDRTGSTTSKPFQFTASQTDGHGFVRVSPRNKQYFEFDDGTAYFPVGANVCWGNDPGLFSYDTWIPNFSKFGANYMRLWLGPSWVTFAMEVKGKPEEGNGIGQFALGNAWRLDQVLQKAQAADMDVMLSIDSYNTLRAHNAYPAWADAPENKDNGGPLRIWSDFWTNSDMDVLYKNKLRYLVARYSAFSNVMSWEFWNEVDLTEDYSADVVQAWHQRMGDALRGMDPYHHLVTTSFSDSMGNRNIDLLPELDYDQTHSYNNPDVAGGVLYQQSRKSEWGKPHYVGEIGADASGPRADQDPGGMQVHDPMWMSLATGSSGTAMSWWWDNLIAPKNLYPLYGAVSRFVKGIDWPGEDFRRGNISLEYVKPPATPQRKALDLENGPVQWADGDSNKPHYVTIRNGKADGDLPLPGIQHGVRNHPAWHNPVRFKVSLDRKTRFVVAVGNVSGYGGAVLQVSLDGDPIMTREFHTGENAAQGQEVSKFSGQYGVDIPAGDHIVTVENIGNDWFMAGYRFIDMIKRTGPALQGWAIEGNNTVIAWIRPEGRTWRKVIVDKIQFPPVPPSIFALDGLAAGDWNCEIWDTWSGLVSSKEKVHVGINGKVRVNLPTISKDVAVKLTRASNTRRNR